MIFFTTSISINQLQLLYVMYVCLYEPYQKSICYVNSMCSGIDVGNKN